MGALLSYQSSQTLLYAVKLLKEIAGPSHSSLTISFGALEEDQALQRMRTLMSFLLLGALQSQSLTLKCLLCFPGQSRTLGLSGILHPTWSVLGWTIGSMTHGATASPVS